MESVDWNNISEYFLKRIYTSSIFHNCHIKTWSASSRNSLPQSNLLLLRTAIRYHTILLSEQQDLNFWHCQFDTHKNCLQMSTIFVFAPSPSWGLCVLSHSDVTLIILSSNVLRIKLKSETSLNVPTEDEKISGNSSNNIHISTAKQKLRLLPKVRIWA